MSRFWSCVYRGCCGWREKSKHKYLRILENTVVLSLKVHKVYRGSRSLTVPSYARSPRILLESTNGSGLEPQVSLEVLSDLPDEPLEGQLADEQLGRLLVTPDLTQGDCAGPVPMRLLHSSGGGGRLPGGLGGQLLPGGLASGGLTGGLLRTSHVSQSSAKETLVISLNIDHF